MKWIAITDEMRDCHDSSEIRKKNLPTLGKPVWLTVIVREKPEVRMGRLLSECVTLNGSQYAWYGLDDVRITALCDSRVVAYKRIDTPSPYRG